MIRSGDLVELRTPAEILSTLDSNGCHEGLPFMPEMLRFFGRRFRVTARVERACDTHTWSGTRRFEDTVVLEDLRCDGSGHEGCDARCRLLWREAWLRKATGADSAEPEAYVADRSFAELERVARQATRRPGSTDEPTFRCQATELLTASVPVHWWSPASLLRELLCGNVGLRRFVRVMAGAVLLQLRQRVLRQGAAPRPAGTQAGEARPQGLRVGQRVRVRSREEIASMLDANLKTRGLYFDFPEMGRCCGRTSSVVARVERFIDERSGRMIELSSDAYILNGFACSGDYSTKRWFCPRAICFWWREGWLEPVGDGGGTTPHSQT